MRRALFLATMMLFSGVALVLAQNILSGFPPGAFTGRGALDAAGGAPPAFTGVFDVAACGANCAYWGTRAASAADRGNKLMNVCNVADIACADLSSDATTGALVISTIGGVTCGTTVGVNVCTVKTLYDRGNATFCNTYSTVCDLAQATIASRPTLVPSCGGTGLPCLACNGSSSMTNATVSSFNQPLSVSAVAERTGNFVASEIISWHSANPMVLAFSGANALFLYAGNVSSDVAGTDSVVHAAQALFNDTGSILRVDGTSSSGLTPGANHPDMDMRICAGSPLTGNFFEAAIWNGDLSANFAALYANQKAYWSGIP